MSIKEFKRGEDVQLTKHFHLSEMECHCGECETTLVDMEHMKKLELIRQHFSVPITITSGYRCTAHNASVGGTLKSQHLYGRATDVKVKDIKPSAVWRYVTDVIIFDGVGRYNTFTHIDSRGLRVRFDMR